MHSVDRIAPDHQLDHLREHGIGRVRDDLKRPQVGGSFSAVSCISGCSCPPLRGGSDRSRGTSPAASRPVPDSSAASTAISQPARPASTPATQAVPGGASCSISILAAIAGRPEAPNAERRHAPVDMGLPERLSLPPCVRPISNCDGSVGGADLAILPRCLGHRSHSGPRRRRAGGWQTWPSCLVRGADSLWLPGGGADPEERSLRLRRPTDGLRDSAASPSTPSRAGSIGPVVQPGRCRLAWFEQIDRDAVAPIRGRRNVGGERGHSE